MTPVFYLKAFMALNRDRKILMQRNAKLRNQVIRMRYRLSEAQK